MENERNTNYLLIGYSAPLELPNPDTYVSEILSTGTYEQCYKDCEGIRREDILGFSIIPVPSAPVFTRKDYLWVKTFESASFLDPTQMCDKLIRAKFIPGVDNAVTYAQQIELPEITSNQYISIVDTDGETICTFNHKIKERKK